MTSAGEMHDDLHFGAEGPDSVRVSERIVVFVMVCAGISECPRADCRCNEAYFNLFVKYALCGCIVPDGKMKLSALIPCGP